MQGIVAFPGQIHLGDMGCSETTSSNDWLHGGELDSSDPWRRDGDDLGGRRRGGLFMDELRRRTAQR